MALSSKHCSRLVTAVSVPKPFYGEGIWTFNKDDLTLFLKSEPRHVSLAKDSAVSGELEKLVAACRPATFGLNKEDVLDESYRKAGKLDKSDFAINIDVAGSGLLDNIHNALFGWEKECREIRAELYKLNVYGPGSFLKSHKDTPRGEDMFGSLVLNFPIKHTGGALVLRHGGQEITHDSIKASYTEDSQVSWVAFFSDVEHEVLLVTSGNRVTITYKLYHRKLETVAPPTVPSEPLVEVLKSLLADPKFFPEGGRLGFGLLHQYAVPASKLLEDPTLNLKSNDHALFTATAAVGLVPKVQVVYDADEQKILTKELFWENSGTGYDENIRSALLEYMEGSEAIAGEDVEESDTDLVWVVPFEGSNTFGTKYAAYGNDASIETVYANVVLIAHVKSAARR